MTSLLIGCGNLGKIILRGFISSRKEILVLENNRRVVSSMTGILKTVKFLKVLEKIEWKKISYIMLCVKPKDAVNILSEIRKYCDKTHVIVSFVAGLQTKTISKIVLSKSPVVRVMPNIFIDSNNSATAFFSNKIKESLKKKIAKDLKIFGKCIWLNNEKKMDFFTAMFGGGPAYFFYILDCFDKIIRKNGIKVDDSLSLLTTLLEGTLIKLKSRNVDFKKSIRKVASQGGTTEEALKVFDKNSALFNLFNTAINSAKQKSSQISKQLK
tara:strand:+ start:159 stop:965 length:807 start_codon:yes stop_codon:yes gene_type:complete